MNSRKELSPSERNFFGKSFTKTQLSRSFGAANKQNGQLIQELSHSEIQSAWKQPWQETETPFFLSRKVFRFLKFKWTSAKLLAKKIAKGEKIALII